MDPTLGPHGLGLLDPRRGVVVIATSLATLGEGGCLDVERSSRMLALGEGEGGGGGGGGRGRGRGRGREGEEDGEGGET